MFKVQDTNIEALKSKKSAILKNYMKDDFINYFVPQNIKKDIIMNRGYWLRHYCFNKVAQKFLETHENSQIISLGCGLDTLPFNLLKNNKQNFKFIEIDLPDVINQKIKLINKNIKPFLQQKLKDIVNNQNEFISNKYILKPCNLNNVESLINLFDKLNLKGKPTLVISECVLVYLEQKTVPELQQLITNYFDTLVWADYEMLDLKDNFAKTMKNNFSKRGIELKSIENFSSIQKIKVKYENLKCQAEVYDLYELYYQIINQKEIQRINSIERIDEFEELNLIFQHYFFSLATKNTKINIKNTL